MSRTNKRNARYLPLTASLVGLIAAPNMAQAQASGSGEFMLEEIIVTAQRREQSVLDIPAALAVISGDQIRDQLLTTSHALELSTPGLTFHSVSGTSQVTLRGVGTGYAGPALGNSVALYTDDSYVSNQVGAIEVFYDMERVEVLKGPQPTLYGRNATGGTIQFISNKPNLDAVSGYIEGSFAELETVEFEGAFNLPLGDTVALRVAGKSWDRGEGHVKNINTGEKITGLNDHKRLRAQLLFQPSDQFSAVFKYEYGVSKGDDPLRRQNATGDLCFWCVGGDDGNALGWYETDQTPIPVTDQGVIDGFGYNPIAGGTLERRMTLDVFALNMDWAINDVWTVSSRTQYRDIYSGGGQDQDANFIDHQAAFSAVNPEGPDGIVYQSFTQELRIASDSGGRFDVTAGVFYEEDDNQFAFGVGGQLFNARGFDVTNFDDIESYAVFVEGYFNMTENLTLTVGGRYTDDKVTHGVKHLYPGQDVSHFDKFDKFTPRVALNYRADWGSVYASYSKGFKAGGYNSPNFGAVEPVKEESIDAYEIGAKLTPADNIQIELAAFHYDWEDLQIAIIDTGSLGISQENAAGAEIDGFEAAIRWAGSQMVSVGLSYAYLDGKYLDYGNASGFVPRSTVDADGDGVADDPSAKGLTRSSLNYTGTRTAQTPENSFAADLTVEFPITGEWSGRFVAIASYSDEYDMIPGAGGPVRLTVQDDFTVVNLTLDIENQQSGLGLQLYVENATDEKYLFESQTTNHGGYQGVQFPRIVGVRIRKTW
jgi:iron complex outermembrane recepter protein